MSDKWGAMITTEHRCFACTNVYCTGHESTEDPDDVKLQQAFTLNSKGWWVLFDNQVLCPKCRLEIRNRRFKPTELDFMRGL